MRGRVVVVGVALVAGLATAGEATAASPLRPPSWLRVAPTRAVKPSDVELAPARRAALTAEGYGFVDVLRRHEIDLRPSKDVVTTMTYARCYLNEEGASSAAELSFDVNTAFETAELLEAWVLTPAGVQILVDPSTVQISSQPRSGLFSDAQTVTVPFAGVSPGSTAVIRFRLHRDPRKFPLPWSARFFTQLFSPIERLQIRIQVGGAAWALAWNSNDTGLDCEADDHRVACERRQIPAVTFEPSVTWIERLPHFIVAERTDWQTLADRQLALVAAQVDAATPALKQLAASLIDGAEDDEQKLARLQAYVSQRVRYLGFEHGASAVVPHRASVTAARGFGDCKDKTTLFVALAKNAGLEASPALLSTELHSTEQMLLPSLSYFDHMIACVDLPRARRCTDLTVPGLHVDEVPMGLHGAIAFVLQPRRAGVFSWQSKGAFAIDVDTRVHLACDGAAQDETTRRFSGPAAAFVRSSLASQTKAARTKEITERYKSVVGRGEPFDVGVTGLDEYDRDVSIKTSARWRPSDSPLQAGEIADADPWLLDYAVSFRATNVQHPFRHEGLSLVSRRRYELCSTLGGKLFGAELDLRSEFGQLTRSYKADGPNVVTVETRVDLPPGEVPTERLDAYRAFLTGALAQTDVWFSVVPHGR